MGQRHHPDGWLYLAVILDQDSRHVDGWAVSPRMK
jgi:transposase InsO family protein